MILYKTPYKNARGKNIPEMSQRMEFFLHYWQYIFRSYRLKIDTDIFKSHRTVLNKIRLEINGNFSRCANNIKVFYKDEDLFKNADPLITYITNKKIKANFDNLKTYLERDKFWTDENLINPINKEIDTIDKWLNKYYAIFIAESLQKLISKNENLNEADISQIKKLANCFVIELIQKGLNLKSIDNIHQRLFDARRFPFKKTLSDFLNKEDYEKYKSEILKKFDLKTQLKGIVNIAKRKPRSFYVIFRVHHVKFNHAPIKIFNAEIYNPLTHPKVKPTKRTFTNEDFGISTTPLEKRSACNIIVKTTGTENDAIIFKAYKTALRSLNVFNERLELNGEINLKTAFITELTLDTAYSSTSANENRTKEISEIDPGTLKFLKFLNRLPNKNNDDRKLNDFYGRFSRIIQKRNTPIQLEELWYSLESTFGKKVELIKLFKSVYRIYLNDEILVDIRWFLYENLENHMKMNHAKQIYFLNDTQLKKHGFFLKEGTKLYSVKKFKEGLADIKNLVSCTFITYFIEQHELYFNNRSAYYTKLDKWIECNLTELYAERNLKSHSSMQDDFFYQKKKEIIGMVFLLLRVFFAEYKKEKNANRTIEYVINSISNKAEKLS